MLTMVGYVALNTVSVTSGFALSLVLRVVLVVEIIVDVEKCCNDSMTIAAKCCCVAPITTTPYRPLHT